VPHAVFENSLPALEKRTQSRVEASTTHMASGNELPIVCRVSSAILWQTSPRKRSITEPPSQFYEYQIRSGDQFLRLSVIVLRDRAHVAIISTGPSSATLRDRWSAALKTLFPALAVRVQDRTRPEKASWGQARVQKCEQISRGFRTTNSKLDNNEFLR
jgi:hypothetical protein